MRTLKYLLFTALFAAAASSILAPAQAQSDSAVDIKATADAIQTLEDQQKIIVDNQTKIDAKLATITENVRIARLYGARAR